MPYGQVDAAAVFTFVSNVYLQVRSPPKAPAALSMSFTFPVFLGFLSFSFLSFPSSSPGSVLPPSLEMMCELKLSERSRRLWLSPYTTRWKLLGVCLGSCWKWSLCFQPQSKVTVNYILLRRMFVICSTWAGVTLSPRTRENIQLLIEFISVHPSILLPI